MQNEIEAPAQNKQDDKLILIIIYNYWGAKMKRILNFILGAAFLIWPFFSITTVQAAEAVTVTYNSNSHTIAYPLEKSFLFVATIKNTSAQKKKVTVALPKDQNRNTINMDADQFTILSSDSFYELNPGEEVNNQITFEIQMNPNSQGQNKQLASLDTELNVTWEGGEKKIPISIKTAYVDQTELSQHQCKSTFKIIDKETKKPISNVSVTAIFQSALDEKQGQKNGSNYELSSLCGDYLKELVGKYSVDHKYPGYLLSVLATGYKGYFDPNFLSAQNETKEIALEKLGQVGVYNKVKELATGFSIWWIKSSADEKYFAFSQGTHGGPGIVIPATTKITFTDNNGNKLWDKEVNNECWGLDVSVSGSYVAAGCNDGKIHVWTKTGEEAWNYNDNKDTTVRWVKFSPDEKYLLSGPAGGRAENAALFETASGKLLWSYYIDNYLREGRFSDDSKTVYAASGAGGIFALDTATGSLKYSTSGNFSIPFVFGFSNSVKTLISAGKGRTFTAVDLDTGQKKWQTAVDQTITAGEVANDGFVVGATVGGMAYGILPTGEINWARNYGGSGHNGVWYTKNGDLSLIGGSNPTLFNKNGNVLWRREKDKTQSEMYGPQSINTGGAYDTWVSENGNLIILGGDDGKIQFWQGEVKDGSNDYSQTTGFISNINTPSNVGGPLPVDKGNVPTPPKQTGILSLPVLIGSAVLFILVVGFLIIRKVINKKRKSKQNAINNVK